MMFHRKHFDCSNYSYQNYNQTKLDWISKSKLNKNIMQLKNVYLINGNTKLCQYIQKKIKIVRKTFIGFVCILLVRIETIQC